MNGQTEGWTEGRTNIWKFPTPLCVPLGPRFKNLMQTQILSWHAQISSLSFLQDLVPFRAIVLHTLFPIYNHTKQGNGYRWPNIVLGQSVYVHVIFGLTVPAQIL